MQKVRPCGGGERQSDGNLIEQGQGIPAKVQSNGVDEGGTGDRCSHADEG